jgi:carbamoyltransferase
LWRQTLEYHPIIGYRFIPGIKARVNSLDGGYLIQTNDSGFRCRHNFEKAKNPGIRRILLFGDSFTAGDGVSNDKRYGDILEDIIPNLEVYNFGLPATGTDQQYLAYKEYALDIEHDLLIIAIFLENIRRVISHYRNFKNEKDELACYAKPYFEINNGKLLLKNVPLPRSPIDVSTLSASEKASIYSSSSHTIMVKLASEFGLKGFLQKYFRYQPSPEYNSPQNSAWILLRAILEQWINNHPKPVLLLAIPQDQYIRGLANPSPYRARFDELALRTKCTFHDPLPELIKYPLAEREAFRLSDYHYSSRGHSALAASVAPIVRSLLDN